MKQFLLYILKLLLIIIVMLIVLDIIYTSIYINPVQARSKVSWLKNLKPNQQYDYALFGSSRCFYHVNSEQIKIETGVNGINLAYPGSNNFEIKLMVKEFLKQQQTNKIFIQVDEQYNKEYIDQTAIVPWMPYIYEESIYNEIKPLDNTAFYKKHIPFYRYMVYDSKLGFRELLMNFVKPNLFEKTLGFSPRYGQIKESNKLSVFKLEDKKNKQLEEIIDICKQKEIELYFFTTPYYNTDWNASILNKNLPNYKDFSKTIKQKEMFKDYSHLNEKGAKYFTKLFYKNYFIKK